MCVYVWVESRLSFARLTAGDKATCTLYCTSSWQVATHKSRTSPHAQSAQVPLDVIGRGEEGTLRAASLAACLPCLSREAFSDGDVNTGEVVRCDLVQGLHSIHPSPATPSTLASFGDHAAPESYPTIASMHRLGMELQADMEGMWSVRRMSAPATARHPPLLPFPLRPRLGRAVMSTPMSLCGKRTW